MEQIGKTIVLLAVALAIIGALIWGLGKAGFKGLPGDLRIESENFRIYFPIVTCIVISVLLTLALWLWQWLRRP